MSSVRAACLYQETRLNLDPAFPNSTVDVLIPANGASAFASRSSPKRRRLDPSDVKYDEETFSKLHLASEASIYFRPHLKGSKKHETPGAVLWRILEERTVLELQAVDLTQDQAEKDEPFFTLRLRFPDAIKTTGVTFTEDNHDVTNSTLTGFVVTVSGEVFILKLQREAFLKTSGVDSVDVWPADWCNSFTSSAFTYRTPYRLLAQSASEFWASLSDGSLVKFERQNSNNSAWRESFYTDGGWKATMRGLLVWKPQNTVRYEDVDLHASTACSMVASPDGKHLWTVCLDHTLKAWSMDAGKVTFVADLSNDTTRDLTKPAMSLLDPARSQLIRVLPTQLEGEYVVVTFSPQSSQFKFWTIKDADAPEYGIDDMAPEIQFIPPIEDLTNTKKWTLESFHVKVPHTARAHEWALWLLVRCEQRAYTFHVSINLNDHVEALKTAWHQKWSIVYAGLNSDDALKQNLQNPTDLFNDLDQSTPIGPAEQWQSFLFHPGRFTTSTLKAALSVYWRSLGPGLQSRKHTIVNPLRPLQEQISETVGLSLGFTRNGDGSIAYERFQHDLTTQWQVFYGVVRNLHKRREEVLCLTYDAEQDLPWLIMADELSPIRMSSDFEVLVLNRDFLNESDDMEVKTHRLRALTGSLDSNVGQLLNAAALFRQSFSRKFLGNMQYLLQHEALQDATSIVSDRLQAIYDKSGFAGKVSDEDYNKLTYALDAFGGFASMENELFTSALELLAEAQRGHHQKKQLTRYGARALIRGAQENLEFSFDMVLNLLILIIFIGGDLEEGDLPSNFDARAVFDMLLKKLRELSLLCWMASTSWQEPLQPSQQEKSPETVELVKLGKRETSQQPSAPMTLLENIFIGDWSSMLFPAGSQSLTLSYSCRAWAFGARLHEQYDSVTTHIMGVLLKAKNIELANDLLKFMPDTRWAIYLEARLQLARGDLLESARCFEAAADSLANGKFFDVEQFDSANLLDPEERTHFNEGLPVYYQHIVSLFEKANAMSYVAHFAVLGLNAPEMEEGASSSVRSDLLARLFTASLQTQRFESACTALTQYTDYALLKHSLRQLLTAILALPEGPHLLLTLPIPSPDQVDAYLSTQAAQSAASTLPTTTAPSTSLLFDTASTSKSSTKPIAYHKLLYAYRLQRNDLRGAATCLWDRLQYLRGARAQHGTGMSEAFDSEIAEMYLVLLNVLSLMDAEQAWILTRPVAAPDPMTGARLLGAGTALDGEQVKLGQGRKLLEAKRKSGAAGGSNGVGGGASQAGEDGPAKRKIVTLPDVRKAWQDELDRRADLRAGRVPFLSRGGVVAPSAALMSGGGGEAMDVDVFA